MYILVGAQDLVSSLFSGVGAGVILSMKPWKGAAKLREKHGYSDVPRPISSEMLGRFVQFGIDGRNSAKSCQFVS